MHGSIPFLSFFRFSSCTITSGDVRTTFTGGRRFFSSVFFSQAKFTFSLLFFLLLFLSFSLSLSFYFSRSLTVTLLIYKYIYLRVCVSKKKEISSTNGVITIFQFSLLSFREISIHMCVCIRLMLSR